MPSGICRRSSRPGALKSSPRGKLPNDLLEELIAVRASTVTLWMTSLTAAASFPWASSIDSRPAANSCSGLTPIRGAPSQEPKG